MLVFIVLSVIANHLLSKGQSRAKEHNGISQSQMRKERYLKLRAEFMDEKNGLNDRGQSQFGVHNNGVSLDDVIEGKSNFCVLTPQQIGVENINNENRNI